MFFSLFFLSSCATKYLVPANRFITPETNGGVFKGQVEIQQASATQLTINTTQGSVEDGVLYETLTRTGFMYSNSFFENFDLFWIHIASGNSMLGAKFQILGGSQASKSAGHKIALAAAFGANEHETEDAAVEFKLGGRELMILYGFRINEMLLPYASLAQLHYSFMGEIVGGPASLRGLKPELETSVLAFTGGVEIDVGPVIGKIEGTYQQLTTTDTKKKEQLVFGWALGYSW